MLVMCFDSGIPCLLCRFQQLDPKNEGPLMGMDLDKNFRTMLCDKVSAGPGGETQVSPGY